MRIAFRELMIAFVLMAASNVVNADEGMWLYNDPPCQLLKDKYGVELSEAWLEHLQTSSVRFNRGGSGSFVSEDGLVLTNHHVGAGTLQKLSDEEHDYYRDGFHARTREEEKRCLDLELNVLMSIEDVTERVNAAVRPGMDGEASFAARRAVMADIEEESLRETGLRSDVVTLYRGARYHLYRFKKYTDVRLVFAPERQIAFFGGNVDNFEYPRFVLDICLFRVYENDKPLQVQNYLRWSPKGVSEGDLIFVSGHPGHTSRHLTLAELESRRDDYFPYALGRLQSLEVMLLTYSERSDENARRAKRTLFGVQNSRKSRQGMFQGLLDPRLMAKKQLEEQILRAAAAQDPNAKEAGSCWDRIADAEQVIARNARQYALLERTDAFNSTLFDIASTLVRAVEEKAKPSGERLREFRDSNLESLEFQLFSKEPIYDDFEQVKLTQSLTWLVRKMGHSHPLVRKVLAGKTPRARAAELVLGTKVKNVATRRKLYTGTVSELQAAADPMIDLARLVDRESRAVREIVETQEEIKRQAHARIAHVRFAMAKGASYPDATFTLRLAFGTVRGYEEGGQWIPFQTTFAGLYKRAAAHHLKPPFEVPQRWLDWKDTLDLSTPFNFVSTADITGGNSGSPVVNRQGEFVGIIFDCNLQGLPLDFAYMDVQARAISVNSQAIIEALRNIYDAGELADELLAE